MALLPHAVRLSVSGRAREQRRGGRGNGSQARKLVRLGTRAGEGADHRALGERVLPAYGHLVEGDEPDVNAEHGRQLIGNGLAEEVKPKAAKAAPLAERVSTGG